MNTATCVFRIAALTPLLLLAASPVSATLWEVQLVGISFIPATLTIEEGDTIEWFNTTAGVHTSTSGPVCSADSIWDSGIMSPGARWSFAFDSTGTFPYFCIPHCGFGMRGTIIVDPATGIGDLPAIAFALKQNYPNPFNPSTRIEYFVEQTATVRIDVFDSAGHRVTTLINELRGPGPHVVEWNGLGSHGIVQATGLYYYRLLLNGHAVETRKMVLLK